MKVAKIVLKIVWRLFKLVFVFILGVLAFGYTGILCDRIKDGSKFYEKFGYDAPKPGEHAKWMLRHKADIDRAADYYAEKAFNGWDWIFN